MSTLHQETKDGTAAKPKPQRRGHNVDQHCSDVDLKVLDFVLVRVKDWHLFKAPERAIWHFRRLRTKLPKSDFDLKSNATVVNKVNKSAEISPDSPTTDIRFVYSKYRFVLTVDLSSSISVADPEGVVAYERLLDAIGMFLAVFTTPIEIDNVSFVPEIYICIMAVGLKIQPMKSIIYSCLVTKKNLGEIIPILQENLIKLENAAARQKSEFRHHNVKFQEILQNSQFGLDRMPEDACPMIVVFTDGVLTMSEPGSYDGIIAKCVRKDISICAVQISGRDFHPDIPFGYVPDTDLLEILCNYTNGQLLDVRMLEAEGKRLLKKRENSFRGDDSELAIAWSPFEPSQVDLHMKRWNVVQTSILVKSSPLGKQVHHRGSNLFFLSQGNWDNNLFPVRDSLPIENPKRLQLGKLQHPSAGLERIIEVRTLEGFKNGKVELSLEKGAKTVKVNLYLEWKYQVTLDYEIETHQSVSSEEKRHRNDWQTNTKLFVWVSEKVGEKIKTYRTQMLRRKHAHGQRDTAKIPIARMLYNFAEQMFDVDRNLQQIHTTVSKASRRALDPTGIQKALSLPISRWNRWFRMEHCDLLCFVPGVTSGPCSLHEMIKTPSSHFNWEYERSKWMELKELRRAMRERLHKLLKQWALTTIRKRNSVGSSVFLKFHQFKQQPNGLTSVQLVFYTHCLARITLAFYGVRGWKYTTLNTDV